MLWARVMPLQDAERSRQLPPKHQAVIPVDLVNDLLREAGKECYCSEARILAPRVYSSHTLLPEDRYNVLAVHVLNTTSRPVRIMKGRDLGELPSNQPPETNKTNKSETEIIKLPNELSPRQHVQAVIFIAKYKDMMSTTSDLNIGRTHLMEHDIDTGNAQPIRQQLYCHPVTHLEEIDQNERAA